MSAKRANGISPSRAQLLFEPGMIRYELCQSFPTAMSTRINRSKGASHL